MASSDPTRFGLGLPLKLAVVIVAVGATALVLLGLRQSRLVAAREMARARLEVRAVDEEVSAIRSRIAQRVHPEIVEELVSMLDEAVGPIEPIVVDSPRRPAELMPAGDAM